MSRTRPAPEVKHRFYVPELAKALVEETLFFNRSDCPFSGHFFDGDNRVLVITGENAAGKSFLFRVLSADIQAAKMTPITLSIRERTGGGTFEMARMRQSFMYGSEAEQSTGATSARVVKAGFHNAGRESPGVLMLDEPEMGLSDGYARALGELIGTKARLPEDKDGMRECCHGVVVVTHNRALVGGLLEGLRASPAFINMSATPVTLNDWLLKGEYRSMDDLENLQTLAGERRKTTARILGELKS